MTLSLHALTLLVWIAIAFAALGPIIIIGAVVKDLKGGSLW